MLRIKCVDFVQIEIYYLHQPVHYDSRDHITRSLMPCASTHRFLLLNIHHRDAHNLANRACGIPHGAVLPGIIRRLQIHLIPLRQHRRLVARMHSRQPVIAHLHVVRSHLRSPCNAGGICSCRRWRQREGWCRISTRRSPRRGGKSALRTRKISFPELPMEPTCRRGP